MSGAYVYSGAFIPGTLARAEQVGVEYTSVAAGFSVLAIQGTDSGVANAYIVTTAGGKNGVYTDGMIVEFKALNANTTSSTITVDGGSVVGLTNSIGQSLAGGALSANTWYRALYNSTYSAWTVVAPTSLVTTSNTISAAAPTNKVGLTAAGGVSTACAPIDATYALDQSIAPTWTGAHTFSNTVTFNSSVSFATGLSLAGAAGSYALTLTGSSTTGQSKGLLVKAGTNSSDISALFQNQSGASTFFQIDGAGSLTVGAPTGGGQGVGTLNAVGLYIQGVAVSTTSVSGANPTGTIGLSAVNGSAATFLRSDGAPALSQAIAPTWTAAHIFTPSSAVTALTINAKADAVGLIINGGTNTGVKFLARFISGVASGFSSGVYIQAGTTSADTSFQVANASAGANYMLISGDGSGYLGYNGAAPTWNFASTGLVTYRVNAASGYITFQDDNASAIRGYIGYGSGLISGAVASDLIVRSEANLRLAASGNNEVLRLNGHSGPTIQGWGPTAGALTDMTPDTGSFTGTLTGFTPSNPTGTCIWSRNGNQVTLFIPILNGTSNTTALTLTGLPAAIQPVRTQRPAISQDTCENNSALLEGNFSCQVAASGTVTFLVGNNASGWTNSGNKGFFSAVVISYLLN
jgi:hypothetical protein